MKDTIELKDALEKLVSDLKVVLAGIDLKPVEGKEFDLDLSNPEIFEHSQLGFYDPENCDGFKRLPSEVQQKISQQLCDANSHVYPENTCKALWNATNRSLYSMYSAWAIPKFKTHRKYVSEQYRYLDATPVTTAGAETLEEAHEKNLNYLIPSCAPQVVDKHTYALAKCYKNFLDTAVNVKDPMKGTYATESMKEQYTPQIFAQLKTTQRELDSRIALYEARLKINRQKDEENDKDREDLISCEKKFREPLSNALRQYRGYFELSANIRCTINIIAENDSETSYADKIAMLRLQLDKLEPMIESIPTPESSQKTLNELKEHKAQLPTTSRYLLAHNYLGEIAQYKAQTGHYDTTNFINDTSANLKDFYRKNLIELSYYIQKIGTQKKTLSDDKENLQGMIQVLEELDRISTTIEKAKNLVDVKSSKTDLSTTSEEDLIKDQSRLNNTLHNLNALKKELVSRKFEDNAQQTLLESGLNKMGLSEISVKIEAQLEDYQKTLINTENKIRKHQLEAAKSNLQDLVKFKQAAMRDIGIHAETWRSAQQNKTLYTSYSNIAQKNIDGIELNYANTIKAIKDKISDINQSIKKCGIKMGDDLICNQDSLKTLKSHLLATREKIKDSGIPLSEKQFEELKVLLNWDNDDIEHWSYIKDSSVYTWLSTIPSRSLSYLYLSDTPEQDLMTALDDQFDRTEEAINSISHLETELAKTQHRLARIQNALNQDCEPNLLQIREAESKLVEFNSQISETEVQMKVHNERSVSADTAMAEQLYNCVQKLREPELTLENCQAIKKEFAELKRIGRVIFGIIPSELNREFDGLFEAKTTALSPNSHAKGTLEISASQQAAIETGPLPAAPEHDDSLFKKYFNPDPQNAGLSIQYLKKRAKDYALFDKIDSAITSGLRFFSSQAQTDQNARKNYLDKIAGALNNYNDTRDVSFLKGAYNLVASVLNDPKKFPARAAKNTPAYQNSMRALLSTMMTDLEQHPQLQPIVNAAKQEARDSVENPVYWRP